MSRSQPRGSFSSILEKEKKERERVVTGKNKRSATLENYMRKKNKTVLPISMSLNILVSIEGIKRLVYNLSGNRPKPDPAQENLNLEGLSRFPEKNSSCIFFFLSTGFGIKQTQIRIKVLPFISYMALCKLFNIFIFSFLTCHKNIMLYDNIKMKKKCMKTSSKVPATQELLKVQLSFFALSLLSQCTDNSRGDSVCPNFNNCLCNSKLYPVVSISKQMGDSLCVVVITVQTVIFIFQTLSSFVLLMTLGAFSRRVTNATQFNMETLPRSFHFLDEILAQLFGPAPFPRPSKGLSLMASLQICSSVRGSSNHFTDNTGLGEYLSFSRSLNIA